jgi:hypothetical protein
MSSSKSSNTPSTLRSREAFFLCGAVPVPAQPEDCTICTEALETDVIKILIYGHSFHLVCVLAWFKSNSARHGSCPNRRCEFFGAEPRPVPADAPDPATVDGNGRDDAWYVNAEREVELANARRNRARYEDAARAELAAATADRSRVSNPQQSTGRAVRPSLPPRASSPVRYPRRSTRASAPRNDYDNLEELDGEES